MHQPFDAVVLHIINAEINKPAVRASQLGADAGVGWLQAVWLQPWPPALHRSHKRLLTTQAHRVVWLRDPFHIRPEPGLSGKIQGQVNPQSAGLGYGINQGRKRMLATVGKVHPSGIPGLRAEQKIVPPPAARQSNGVQSCRVNNARAADPTGGASSNFQLMAPAIAGCRYHWRLTD